MQQTSNTNLNMMQPPRAPRDDDSISLAGANSTAGDSSSLAAMSTTSSSHPHLRPILVGYAFGPKKMSTMGLIMAEASRAQLSTVVTAQVPLDSIITTPEQQSSSLTTAALASQARHELKASSPSVVLSMSRGPSGGFRNIVRYFRSSCSSVASDDTLTTAASTNTQNLHSTASCRSTSLPTTTTTTTTTTSRQQQQQQQHPVRVSFVPLDLDSPLEEQHGGNFDAILHKLTEDILCLSTLQNHVATTISQTQAMSRVARLEQYCQTHPTCSLVDHPSHVQVVLSRLQIAFILTSSLEGVTSKSGIPISTPRFEIYQGNGSSVLQPPLIAKPLQAAGTSKSHCMGVVLQRQGLSKIQETPCLLQQYVNHNSLLYKVYVMGDFVDVFERPSLPNLPISLEEGFDFCEFDSQRPYPTLQDFGLEGEERDLKRTKFNEQQQQHSVTVEEIRPVANVLKQAFGLELFGFDILVTSSGNEFLVVDVNYFPSYKEVSNFPSLLANYLTQRAIDGRMASPI